MREFSARRASRTLLKNSLECSALPALAHEDIRIGVLVEGEEILVCIPGDGRHGLPCQCPYEPHEFQCAKVESSEYSSDQVPSLTATAAVVSVLS
jgi:hypothetical protein